MTTLREAREKGKLEELIKERESDPKGDAAALDRTVSAMAAGKNKPVEKPE